MAEERFPILQSGFVSMTAAGLTKPKPPATTLGEDILMKTYLIPSNKFFYSEKVSDLYRRWMGDHKSLNNFEFREELIRVFKEVLGTNNFGRWVEFQSRKPSLGNTHVSFLQSTLSYIYTGTPREVAIEQWTNLVDADMSTTIVEVNDDIWFGSDDGAILPKLPSNVDRIIAQWTSIPGGFIDFMTFVYIVYGQRTMKNNAISQV